MTLLAVVCNILLLNNVYSVILITIRRMLQEISLKHEVKNIKQYCMKQ